MLGTPRRQGYLHIVRTKLRVAALLLALIVIVCWFFGGPNLGWSKDSVAHKYKDPVTELEVDMPEKRYVPGIDFLAAGVVLAGLLAVGSFFFAKAPHPNGNNPSAKTIL